MTVVHFSEPKYGDALTAQTWVANFRRGILSRREIRVCDGSGVVAAASQEWVHVSDQLKPVRASEACLAAFEVEDVDVQHALPEWTPSARDVHYEFTFDAWHTWMDPLGHANHPMYLDWCDESVSRWMFSVGLTPVELRPVAETITWKLRVEAPQTVVVQTALKGQTENGDAVFEHVIRNDTGALCASATTVRSLADGPKGQLFRKLAGG